MGNQAVGEAFFAKVAEIWYRYLKNFFDKIPEEQ
jgi:predicted proteasome-type protease